jgi:hexosaminidase
MKKILIAFGLAISLVACVSKTTSSPHENYSKINIIPKPVKAEKLSGSFVIDQNSEITFSENNQVAKKAARFFSHQCKTRMGLELKDTNIHACEDTKTHAINFLVADSSLKIPKEGYTLSVSQESIEVRANDYAGFFYGIQSILQLMPTEVFQAGGAKLSKVNVDCATITDYPRFVWRAMMLDCSRQFFDTNYIKRYIDYLASLKMNVFHWHLTDDDGWRIEIKSWPKLTQKGAWRGKGCVLPASRGSKPDEVYGGFYTQEEIKEIVAYGLARNVNILPEIDVPGHSLAVTASYPEVLCKSKNNSKSVQGIRKNVWCAGRDENFKMIDDIIREVTTLFPFQYIHIGGDEVNKSYWKSCEHCQNLMKEKGFRHVSNIQNYFIRRLEKIVKSHHRSMIGWNEIMHGGELEKDTAIMSWTGTGPGYAAAKKGHPVIMAPGPYTYFDMAQYPGERGHWWAGIINTQKTYSFDPMSGHNLHQSEIKNIFGVEACLWGEFLDKPKNQADFQTFPRLCALAEIAWTPQSQRQWTEFNSRLASGYLKRLDAWKIHYRIPTPTATVRKGFVTIHPPFPGAKIYYTTDGSVPTKASTLWDGQPKQISTAGLRMVTIQDNGTISPIIKGANPEPIATWNERTFSKAAKNWTIDLSKDIDEAGNWTLELRRTWGRGGVEIKEVTLLEDGKEIYKNSKSFIIANKKQNKVILSIPIKNYSDDHQYKLILTSKFFKERKTRGLIILDKSPWLEPMGAKVETNMQGYGNYKKENIVDWDRGSYFWLNRQPKKGDQITISFKDIVDAKYLEVITGKPNQSKDILVDGILEISTDGKTFTKVSNFEFGTAKAKINQKIKAIKIKCIAGQSDEWLIIQDIRLK